MGHEMGSRLRKRDKLAEYFGRSPSPLQHVSHGDIPAVAEAAHDEDEKMTAHTSSVGSDDHAPSPAAPSHGRSPRPLGEKSQDAKNGGEGKATRSLDVGRSPRPLGSKSQDANTRGEGEATRSLDVGRSPRPLGEKSLDAKNRGEGKATRSLADVGRSPRPLGGGKSQWEENAATRGEEEATRALDVSRPGKRASVMLSDVPVAGALVRDHSMGSRAARDGRLSNAAALFGPATLQYTSAVADAERDEGKVLGRIYAEFEARQIRLFCQFLDEHDEDGDGGIGSISASSSEEGEPGKPPPTTLARATTLTPSLGRVLTACTELLAETELLWDPDRKKKVRFVMPPRFKSHAVVDKAWTAAVVAVCARHIATSTGGRQGRKMPNLTVTELLDVIAWVEHLHDTMERIDAALASRLKDQGRKMSQEVDLDDDASQPRLFRHDGVSATGQDAEEGLAWAYAALAAVHTRAQDELLMRTQAQTIQWASAAYKAEHEVQQATDGQLFTSLPEDIHTPMSIQLRTLCDRLPRSSDVLPSMIAVVLSTIRSVHLREGGARLHGFERRCAAANDYERMGEEWEGIASEILQECFPPQCQGTGEDEAARGDLKEEVEAVSSELVHAFASDAVQAAKSVLLPVFEPIRAAVEPELFSLAWEENYTQNELAKTLTATLADFLGDVETFVGDYLLEKAASALISASVVFYTECLLKKGGGRGGTEATRFGDNARALLRLSGDIAVIRSYFDGLVEGMPALGRTVEHEFEVLNALHELMSIAAGRSTSQASDFILVLHKRIRNVGFTRKLVGDLWNPIAPQDKRAIKDAVAAMEPSLLAIAPPNTSSAREQEDIRGLRLDRMVAELYAGEHHHHGLGDFKHDIVVKFTRGKEKAGGAFTKATAKLGTGYSVRLPTKSKLAEC